MQVEELAYLPQWSRKSLGRVQQHLGELAAILQHNSSQNSKQAVEPSLRAVEQALAEVDFEELTAAQYNLVNQDGILDFISLGKGRLIRDAVEKAAYDPVTAAQQMAEKSQALSNAISRLMSLDGSLEVLGLNWSATGPRMDERAVMRIHFDHGASISDLADLKRWSSDWYDIARGFAACAGEKTEDFKVVGASTGSVIFVLSLSVAVTGLIALAARHAASAVNSIYEIRNAQENFRHKKIMNKAIEEVLMSTIEEKTKGAKNEIISQIKEKMNGKLKSEVEGQLAISVEKFLEFTQKGGELELLPPPVSGSLGETTEPEIAQLNSIVEETRRIKAETKQLMLPFDRP